MLAHKAEHEAVICVEAIKGLHPHPMDKAMIPGCTYCHPQIASVGLTEAKAKEAGHQLKVGRFNFVANGKAVALGEDSGMVKTIFDAKTGKLLGAHMVGAGSDRADPGLRGRDEPRDHRGRADAHHLPAPDPVGDDEGERC
jgi:dihydrolipoamide dehydrogenase